MVKFGPYTKSEIASKAFLYSSALVVFFLPFGIRWTTYSILLLIVAWLFQNNFKDLIAGLKKSTLLWVFCLPYLLMVMSLIYTQDLKSGLWELEKGAVLLLFPLIFFSAKRLPDSSIDFILSVFVFANVCFGGICVGYAVYKYYTEGVNLFFHFNLVNLFTSHPTYYSMYILFSLVSLYYLNSKKAGYSGWLSKKPIIIPIVLFFFVLIFLLSVRFIFIIFTLAIIGSILIYMFKSRNIKLGLLMLSAFLIMIFFNLRNNSALTERLLQFKDNYSYKLSKETMEGYNGLTTRLAQWESSLAIIKKSPVVGVGPGDVQTELQEVYQLNFLKYSYRDKLNAHNQYFQTCLGLGIVGLCSFLACLIIPGIMAWREYNYLYVSFLIIFAICCVTESMLYVQKGIVFFSFFNALFTFQLLKSNQLKGKALRSV